MPVELSRNERKKREIFDTWLMLRSASRVREKLGYKPKSISYIYKVIRDFTVSENNDTRAKEG